jgi:hypothetical protein
MSINKIAYALGALFTAICAIAIISRVAPSEELNSTQGTVVYPFGAASHTSCVSNIEFDVKMLRRDFQGYSLSKTESPSSVTYKLFNEFDFLQLECNSKASALKVSFLGRDVLKRLRGKFGFISSSK